MLAFDRSQSALANHPTTPSSNKQMSSHRPSNSRSESSNNTLPPRSRSTPPFQTNNNANLPSSSLGPNKQQMPSHYQPQYVSPGQHQPQQGHPVFYPGQFSAAGYGGYGGGMGNVGFNHQQQLYQQQQHLAGWAAAFQHQQMMMNGGTPPVNPFPSSSPHGHPNGPNDLQRPPAHLDQHRRRTSSGPSQPTQSQQQSSSNSSYFPKPNNAGGPRPQGPPFPHANSTSSSQVPEPVGGFHPYRRPDKKTGGSTSRDTSVSAIAGDLVLPPSRPYVRADAPRSDSSVDSAGLRSEGKRRADRERGQERGNGNGEEVLTPSKSGLRNGSRKDDHSRQASASSSVGTSSGGSISSVQGGPPKFTATTHTARKESFSTEKPVIKHRTASSVSTSPNNPSNGGNPPTHRPGSPSGGPSASKQPPKPSPLSQQQAAPQRAPDQPKTAPASIPAPPPAPAPTPPPAATVPVKEKSGGLKGMFGKKKSKESLAPAPPTASSTPAITPSAAKTLPTSSSQSSLGPKPSPQVRSVSAGTTPPLGSPSSTFSSSSGAPFTSAAISDADRQPKKSRSLFNMKNASTDNISIASAASSASMMIRKIGSFGKLAKRNSMSGISSMFKDKEKKFKDTDDIPIEGEQPKKKSGLFRSGKKGTATAPSVTHFAVENDRDQDQAIGGLSPAAALARQHTLKSRAEQTSSSRRGNGGTDEVDDVGRRTSTDVPPTWEKNTATRHGELARQSQEYTRTLPAGGTGARLSEEEQQDGRSIMDSEDGEDFGRGGAEGGADQGVEEARQRMGGVGFDERGAGHDGEGRDWESWGGGSAVRPGARPVKGILKSVSSYSTDPYLTPPDNPWNRTRSNSTDRFQQPSSAASSSLAPTSIATPNAASLGRLPSPDPDHIDGLAHNHPPKSPTNLTDEPASYDPFSPSFSPFDTPNVATPLLSSATGGEDASKRLSFPYANPAHNSSAPALSHFNAADAGGSGVGGPGTGIRSVTAPVQRKELIWAPNCAVYHTFHGSEYDRRSEPATCNRLTPQLAQEIKAFLNQYKLEEMEVHPSSRVFTQYFA